MNAACGTCELKPTHSAIIGGKYYPRLCSNHYNALLRNQMPTSGQGSYDRQRDLEDHLGDVQQPMHGGEINPEWTKLYPDKARQMFGATAVEAAERKN